MEFAEAGLDDWPDSSASRIPPSSLRPQSPPSPDNDDAESRRKKKAEKRLRKELRAARRAAKQSRKEAREDKRQQISGAAGTEDASRPKVETQDDDVLVPSSGQPDHHVQFGLSASPTKQDSPEADGANCTIRDVKETPITPTLTERLQGSQPKAKTPKSTLVVELPSRTEESSYEASTSSKRQPSSRSPTKLNKRPRSNDEESEDGEAREPSGRAVTGAKRTHKGTKEFDLNGSVPAEAVSGFSALSNKESSSKSVKANKQSRSSAGINENAEAGPSEPRQNTPTTPKPRKSTTTSRARASLTAGSTTPRKDRKALDDDELRAMLTNSQAMNEYLASKFHPVAHINRLEAAGILTVRKGKLSNAEIAAVRRHLEVFQQTYRLDEEQLIEVIMAKGKGNARETYPDFWQTLALEIPGRPLRYVVKQVQRMYDPRGKKGPWTAHEDQELIRAHKVHPGEWTKIAAIVERTEQDCRDRWIKEIANSDQRNTGAWTPAEEARLLRIIKETNEAIGTPALSLEAPWDLVAAKMDYQRGPTQCRVKWQREMHPRQHGAYTKGSSRKAAPYKSQEFVDSDLEEEEGQNHGAKVAEEGEELDGIEVEATPATEKSDEDEIEAEFE